ncbi:unnamed protein product [Calypogeia fissa]
MSSMGEKTMMNTHTAAGLDSEGLPVLVMEEASNVDWEGKYGNPRVRRRLLAADLSGSAGEGVPIESTTRVSTRLVIPEGGVICVTVSPLRSPDSRAELYSKTSPVFEQWYIQFDDQRRSYY